MVRKSILKCKGKSKQFFLILSVPMWVWGMVIYSYVLFRNNLLRSIVSGKFGVQDSRGREGGQTILNEFKIANFPKLLMSSLRPRKKIFVFPVTF